MCYNRKQIKPNKFKLSKLAVRFSYFGKNDNFILSNKFKLQLFKTNLRE